MSLSYRRVSSIASNLNLKEIADHESTSTAHSSSGANLVAEIFTEVRIEALERRIIGAGRFRRSGERGSAGGSARYGQSGAHRSSWCLPDKCNRLVLRTLSGSCLQ
jgi:hypothetical protein